jgi:hypothetical protein
MVFTGWAAPRLVPGAEDHHRRLAVEHAVDDLPHRGVEAARGVHAQDHQRRSGGIGAFDGRGDVARGHRVDHAGDIHHRDVSPGRSRAGGEQDRGREEKPHGTAQA